ARVNRVFRDKPGGLVVDYIGIAAELKQALATYTQSGGEGRPTLEQKDAIAEMQRRFEVCDEFFMNQTVNGQVLPGFDYSPFMVGAPVARLRCIGDGLDYILGLPDGKARFVEAVSNLKKAYALASASDEAVKVRDQVAFFEAISAQLTKRTLEDGRRNEQAE